MTFIVNMAAGDANDLWARALARNLVKYIPGNPNIVAQNMAGGGSMISANYLYSVAKPDGLTIGQISASLYFQQLTGRREVQFDWRKFSWIGSAGLVEALLMMRADAPYKSMENIRTAGEPPKCSATAPGSSGHISLKVLEDALGAKFRIVTGYKSGSDQDLAIERGEVQCRSVSSASFLAREPFISWQKKWLRPHPGTERAQAKPKTRRCADNLRADDAPSNARSQTASSGGAARRRSFRPISRRRAAGNPRRACEYSARSLRARVERPRSDRRSKKT